MPESLDSLLHFTSNEVPAVESSHHHHHHPQQQQKHYNQMESSIQQHKHSSGANHDNDYQQQNQDHEQPRARRRYKTEYKKKYRPFSVYQYVDGRFQKSSSAADKIDSHDAKDPWYSEVVELRKKAGEYKYRGLGGEMMSDHMADLYAKQFDVWEQVSRRSSLSALALAATSPRATPEKENKSAPSSASSTSGERKARGGSPAKTLPLGNHQVARPGHAQLVLISTRRAASKQQGEGGERPRREVSQQRSYSAGGSKARSKSVKPSSKLPANVPVSSVSSSSPGSVQANGSAARPNAHGNNANHQRAPARSASVGPERRMPTGGAKSSSSGAPVTRTTPVKAPRSSSSAAAHNNNDVKENAEAARIVAAKKKDEEEPDAPCAVEVTSVGEPEMPALIKSFPEPTRVKSPEQLVVRSPDPVNWTVPLDTAKTFTVTQNIVASSRPHSELKVTMTVRPAPPAHPVAVIKPHVHQPQQEQVATVAAAEPVQVKEAVDSKEDAGDDGRSHSPATPSAPIVASSGSAPENDSKGDEQDETTIAHDEPVITKEPDAVESLPIARHHPLAANAEEERAAPAGSPVNQVDPSEPSDPAPPVGHVAQPIVEAKAELAKETEEKPQVPSAKPDNESQKAAADALACDPLNVAAVLSKPKEEAQIAAVHPVGPVIVPGTTLRRLEDPTPVLFSRPGTLGSLTGQPFGAVAAPAPVAPKGPRYRVLEAPGLEPVHTAHHHVEPSSHSMLPTSSPYKVLEAPASPPKAAGAGVAGSPSSSPMSSNRSLASDVLEKARTRFDRFWTKKDSDK